MEWRGLKLTGVFESGEESAKLGPPSAGVLSENIGFVPIDNACTSFSPMERRRKINHAIPRPNTKRLELNIDHLREEKLGLAFPSQSTV